MSIVGEVQVKKCFSQMCLSRDSDIDIDIEIEFYPMLSFSKRSFILSGIEKWIIQLVPLISKLIPFLKAWRSLPILERPLRNNEIICKQVVKLLQSM